MGTLHRSILSLIRDAKIFFMHNEDSYETIISKSCIIGVYGDKKKTTNFIPCFTKWFECTQSSNQVLGIERHRYN